MATMNSSCLKVTVNGKKFLITGLRKEVLRKDLLCALAKTSDETFQQLKHDGGFVAKQRECVNDELNKSTSDENLLTLLKGDRETAGDFESLKILNSLGKNAKIVKRSSESRGQLKDLPPLVSSSHHSKRTKDKKHNRSRKKHTRELNNDNHKNENHVKFRTERCSSRSSKRHSGSSTATKTSANSHSIDIELSSPRHSSNTNNVKNKHNSKTINNKTTLRSVDDSDLDTYKQPKVVSKLRKRQFRRCYDDSDIDIYNSLYDLVLEQNKKIHNTRSESKQLSKKHQSYFAEENLKVYYIDEINNNNIDKDNNITEDSININIKNNTPINTTANILDESLCSADDNNNANVLISSADNKNIVVDAHINNKHTTAMETSTASCFDHEENVDDVDNDNDSGLPSPEYDSSESTDNQPITLQRAMTKLTQQQQQQQQNKNINLLSSTSSHCPSTPNDGIIDNGKNTATVEQKINAAFVKSAFMKCKQNKNYNENLTIHQQQKQINGLRNENNTGEKDSMCHKNNITNGDIVDNESVGETSTASSSGHCGTLRASGKLSNYNEDVYLQRRSKSLGDLLSAQSLSAFSSENDVFDITNGITDEIDEEKVRLVLKNLTSDKIINMGVLNPVLMNSTVTKNKKKLEKKKINKADISEPQLLSPTQFRRYGSLKNVQTAAKLLKNGMTGMGRSVTVPAGEKEDERKDKEKFYNKKLMEVRRSKRSSKSSKDETKEKSKDKEKLQATDKPPGDTKKSKNVNDKKSKEKDRDKNSKKESKSNKQNELKYLFRREKSFDTSTSNSTTTDPNDDTRSCSSSTCRSSSTEPDTISRYSNSTNKKELDIVDIEKQIYELNKLKIQQQKIKDTENYICQPTETSSLIMDESNLLDDSNDENDDDFHHLHRDPNDDDDIDDEKNGKHSLDDALETTSDYSSLNENIKLESIDDVEDFEHLERTELIALYAREEEAVNDLIEKIFDYNLLIEALSDELDIMELENESSETNEDLIAEEENIYSEIDSVRGLLQSVIDLCAYQRKEMSENLALLDKLDTKVRTKKAGFDILRSGEWRTNSNLAPRSLLKYSKEKKTPNNPVPIIPSRNPNSSVV